MTMKLQPYLSFAFINRYHLPKSDTQTQLTLKARFFQTPEKSPTSDRLAFLSKITTELC